MSSPSSRILPSTLAPGTTSCVRLMARRNVDLPQPDGPIIAVTCLGSMAMLTSARACAAPYQALSPSTSMRLAMAVSGSGKPVAAGEESGGDGEDKDDHDKRQSAGPRTADGDGEGRPGLGEAEQRQPGLGAAGRSGAEGGQPAAGDQQGGRAGRHPGHGQGGA